MNSLATYVAAWKSCATDVEDLLRSLEPEDWSRPTDCPGWTVHDIAAHLAALEVELADDDAPTRPIDTPAARLSSSHTQAGVDARKDATPSELVDEFVEAVRRRAAALDADPPEDGSAIPPRSLGDTRWDWQTLLHNRVIDLWVHEQDIRRAVDRPGNLDTDAARITAGAFAGALPFVIGKRAGAEPGTTVVLVVDGREQAFAVQDDGRCRAVDDNNADPTVRLTMDRETLTILGAGRRDPLTVDVRIDGDRDLGERILQGMAVTP